MTAIDELIEFIETHGNGTRDRNKILTVNDIYEYAQALQLLQPDISGSLNIEFEDWDHTCGDGCCYTYGTDIYLNGEKLDEQNAEDSKNALKVVLEKLGYNVEINYR